MQSILKATFFIPHQNNHFSIISRWFQPSPQNYAKLLKTYAHDRALHKTKLLHAHLITTGLASLTYLNCKLISLYVHSKQLPLAHKLFDKIPQSNPRRWIVLVGAYSQCGFYQEAMKLFFKMQKNEMVVNEFVIPSVLKACGHMGEIQIGKMLHCVVMKHSFELDAFVASSLIVMYSKCGEVELARVVFDEMVVKDLVALNAMVSGHVQRGFTEEGLVLVERMQEEFGIRPNVVTWNTLISGFAQKGDDSIVSKMFELMAVNGVEPDVVSWTSLIAGFVQNCRNKAAFNTFREMMRQGFRPSSATISSLLPACSTMVNVRRGKEIHGYVLVNGVEDDLYVRSALVDLYAKCGFISEARYLFQLMHERNTVTWNSMIFGYANHGYYDEAIELFNQMKDLDRKKIDYLTFMAVLTACGHGGMVELGQRLFRTMQDDYKIVPRVEHYASMVDLLGKAGKLKEAYDMIKRMPVEPDLFVWGALLGASRIYGDRGLAEIAAKHLAKLEPQNSGNNMLLLNVYAEVGSWEDVAKFKKIERRKLSQFPGCSWIEAA